MAANTPPAHGPPERRADERRRVAPESILAAAVALARGPVDGVFLSCTGLRTAGILAAVEAESGKPAVSSNQAPAWHLLRLAGSRHRPEGLGSLFALVL